MTIAKHLVKSLADGCSNIEAMGLKNKILELAAKTFLQVGQVTPEVQQVRMNICLACPKRDEVSNRCKVCKCFLAIKTDTKENLNPEKMRYEVTHCPLGKWNDLRTANHYRKIDGLPLLSKT